MPRTTHIRILPRRRMLLIALFLLQAALFALAEGTLRLTPFHLTLDHGYTTFQFGLPTDPFDTDRTISLLPSLRGTYHAEASSVYALLKCHWLLLTLLSVPATLLGLAGAARLRRMLSPHLLRLTPLPRHLLMTALPVALAAAVAWTISYLQAEYSLRLWQAWVWIVGGDDTIQIAIPFFEIKPPYAIDLNSLKIFLGFSAAGSTKPLLIVSMRWWLIPLALSLALLPILLFRATRQHPPAAFPVSPDPPATKQPPHQPSPHAPTKPSPKK